jgi:hypothetical protein
MIRNGATIGDAARGSGVNRNTLLRYGISKRAVKSLQEAFVIPVPHPDENLTVAEKVHQIERQIAGSFRFAINRVNIPLIAMVEAAQMESDRLQTYVRAARLKDEALRLSKISLMKD